MAVYIDGIRFTTASDSPLSADTLRSLRQWLAEDHEVPAPVVLIEHVPAAGQLGGWPEAVQVALGPGGVLVAVAGAVVTWLRSRTGDVELTVQRADGSKRELSMKRVRNLDGAQVSNLVRDLGDWMADDPARRDT